MVFEDNFVYPFPDTMYDPVLKVRVRITSYHETHPRGVPLAIYYNPDIEADRLTVPVSEEIKALWRSRPQDQHKAEDDSIRWPFKSDKDVKVIDEGCRWERAGEAVRLKISSKSESFRNAARIIKSLNIPKISDNPLSFLIYVYKNYINLSALSDEYYTKELCPAAKRAEICLNADAFLNVFELSPADYAEVEPGWYCLASRELAR
jgi:hypothetical protein